VKKRDKPSRSRRRSGPRDGAHEGADATHDIEDDGLGRDDEEDEVGGGELVLQRIEDAGQAREEAREHDGDDLVALHR